MNREPIAIIGMGCRFPGSANDPKAFWENLINGKDSITEIPEDRWDVDYFYGGEKIHPSKSRSKWGGFVDEIMEFDARFFGISSNEAGFMDPQQRMLLETSWHALEDAGSALSGRNSMGVYVGAGNYEFAMGQYGIIEPVKANPYSVTGTTLSLFSNRISHFLNLTGPSLTVDTACSSSLHAIHLACQAIWNNECSTALAGGVNSLIHPSNFITFSNFNGLSPDGRCKAFDASADGFVKSEGAGMILLKPLHKAIEDKDRIYACIHNTRVNQDGKTPVIAAPSSESQEALICQTLEEAGVSPDLVQYVETHGTGTSIGDPVEANTIGRSIGRHKQKESPCLMGSVKTNIGHLETASGAAGVIKNAMICHHGVLPKNLHFNTPNPDIEFDRYNLKVVTETEPLPNHSDPDKCFLGVNSFGLGGANAFILMSPYVQENSESFEFDRQETDFRYMLPVSARSEDAYKAGLKQLDNMLTNSEENSGTQHVCAFSSIRRTHHKEFCAVLAGKDVPELRAQIQKQLSANHKLNKPVSAQAVFVFAGQGPQWYAMGRDLYKNEKVFRETIQEAHEVLQNLGGWHLLDEFLSPEESSKISNTAYAQPMITALQIGLDRVWRSRGVTPSAVVGHSIGEVAAAVSAGCMDLEEGMRVIYHRGRTMDRASSKGAMLAARISSEMALSIIAPYNDSVSLAAVNGPASVTLSGQRDTLKKVEEELKDQKIFNRFLSVEYAFHSAFMEPIEDDLIESLGDIKCKEPDIPLWSTVTGEKVTEAVHNASYWWKNVRQTVLFGPAIEEIIETRNLFLEISAHPVLTASVKQCMKDKRISGRCVQSLNRTDSDTKAMLQGLNDLVRAGFSIEWETIYPAKPIPHMDFHPYVWHKKKHWQENSTHLQNRLARLDDTLLGRRFDFFDTPTWSNQLDLKIQEFLGDHKVKSHIFFPAAGYIDIFCAAASLCVGEFFELEDFSILMSVVLSTNDIKNIRCQFDPTTHQLTLKVSGDNDTRNWDVCAAAKVYQVSEPEMSWMDIEAFKREGRLHDDKAEFYRHASEEGLNYGPHFQTLEQYWTKENDTLGYVKLPKGDATIFDNTYISPTILDGVFQLIAKEMDKADQEKKLYLPVGFDKLNLQKTAGSSLYATFHLLEHTIEQIRVDITLYDETGDKKGHIRNFICKAVDTKENNSALWRKQVLYEYWSPKPLDWSKSQAAIKSLKGEALEAIHRAAVREEGANLKNRVLMRPEFFDNKNSLMIRFFVDAVSEIIKGYQPGDSIDLESLVKESGASGKLIKYTEKLLAYIAEAGYADKNSEEQYYLTEKIKDLGSIEECMELCVKENPSSIYEINMIYERGQNLVPMFQGTYDPLEMLAGKDRPDYARYLYTNSSWYHGNNQLVMAVIREMVKKIPEGRPFRVLEIGSGMGGMTAHMLDLFKGCSCEFFFTDISSGLVKQAKKQFSEYDFITYQVLDIEQAPETQEFELATFDLITGLDVIHAVQDIDAALSHVAKLLKPEGKFLLSEITGKQLIMDFLFGPIDGWWRFNDAYRIDSPLIEREKWEAALLNNGFGEIEAVSDCDGMAHMNFVAVKEVPEETESEEILKPCQLPLNSGWIIIGDAELPESVGFEKQYSTGDLTRGIDLTGIKGIIYGSALSIVDVPPDEAGQRKVIDLLFTNIIGLLNDSSFDESARLFVLTSGAFPLELDQDQINPLQASMEGMVHVLYNERPGVGVKLIDLDPGMPLSDQIPLLVEEVLKDTDREDVVSFRGGERFVKKCESISRPRSEFRFDCLDDVNNTHAIGLTVDSPGSIDGLCLETIPRRPVKSHEVEIQVEAAGINFRDLLKVLGVYPTEVSDSKLLGDECAGVVVRTGESVTSFSKGDRVAVIGLGCFRTHLILPADRLILLPDSMGLDLAAASLTNYMTAYYTLVVKAAIKQGDRILIHSAAGGVGLAAIQMAKLKGATVFATAGTRFKRDLLKSLGVTHVYNSRTLDFADQIYQDTNGEGIDVVLNSLAGPYIEKSLNLLRDYGRFLELGKRDIYDKTHISLYPFRKNISYFAIDMAEMFSEESTMGQTIVDQLRILFKENAVGRHCYSLFSMANFKDAFNHMSKALHFGKVVLKPSWGELTSPISYTPEKVLVKNERSYLIVGGARGLGLVIAQWLVEKGAKTLILVNRSGKAYPETESEIQALKEKAEVLIYKADVTRQTDVEELIQKVRENHPPLDGIFHCAVVLRDKEIQDLDQNDVYDVLAPKAFGGMYLHEATKDLDLSMFLLMGSIASLFGNLGQSNYAAANTVLKAIAALRHKQGLAAQYIDWGLFSETGIVSRDKELLDKVQKLGFGELNNDNFRAYLERILGSRSIIWGVPGSGLENQLKGSINLAPRFSLIKNRIKSRKKEGGEGVASDFASLSREVRLEKMIHLVKYTISDLLDLPMEDIDNDDKLVDLGIDSLNGIELLTQFENELGASISPTSLVQAPSIGLISERLLTILGLEYDLPKEDSKNQVNTDDEGLEADLNMETDKDLSTALLQAEQIPPVPQTIRLPKKIPVIFLTGVTGLLGSQVFKDLITGTSSHIYLLIRPIPGKTDLLSRLQDTVKKFELNLDPGRIKGRFTLFAGDIAEPRLGLTGEDYLKIQETADVVLHSAAQVHHLKPYSMLKKANVDGTIEILKLCITKRDVIPFHYVSSIAIFVADFTNTTSMTEEDIPQKPSQLRNGYVKSKWVSENIIQLMREKGFPCTVYRPGLIFSKRSMITLAGDFIWRVFKTSLIIGKYPDSAMNLLLTPLESLSSAIMESVRSNQTDRTYHLFESQTRFRDLSREATNLGYNLEPVGAALWHALSLELFEKDPTVHPLADYFNAYDIKIIELMTIVSEQPLDLSCSITNNLLSSFGISQIEVSGDVLKECIVALQEADIIPLPQVRV